MKDCCFLSATAAKLLSHDGDDNDEENVSRFARSKLRSDVAALQLDGDVKYSGRRISRKNITDDDADDSLEGKLGDELDGQFRLIYDFGRKFRNIH